MYPIASAITSVRLGARNGHPIDRPTTTTANRNVAFHGPCFARPRLSGAVVKSQLPLIKSASLKHHLLVYNESGRRCAQLRRRAPVPSPKQRGTLGRDALRGGHRLSVRKSSGDPRVLLQSQLEHRRDRCSEASASQVLNDYGDVSVNQSREARWRHTQGFNPVRVFTR